jgi:hypothetical protein
MSVGYLKSVNHSTGSSNIDEFLVKTRNNITARFDSKSGSFRFLGHGPVKSVWLTCLILKSWGLNGKLSAGEEEMMRKSFDFLKKKQNSLNAVDQEGRNISGGFNDFDGEPASLDVALTAFVLTAFLENREIAKDYTETVDRALSFVHQYSILLKNNFDIALCAYVLALADHKDAESFIELLEANAKTDGNKKYWSFHFEDSKGTPKPLEEIELACYAFLAMSKVKFDGS